MAAAKQEAVGVSGIAAAEDAIQCPSRRRPIDLVHLARQTSGDRGLEAEVLRLLMRHLEIVVERLEDAGEEERRFIAHTLKGAARNIGAFPLADAAQRFEGSVLDGDAIAVIRSEIAETERFVRTLLG